MNEPNPYSPSITSEPSPRNSGFLHAIIAFYAFCCAALATFITVAVALYQKGLNLLPNTDPSLQFVIAAFIAFTSGFILLCIAWRVLRTGLIGSLAAVAVATALFDLSLVGVALVQQIVLGSVRLIPAQRELITPAHYAMNLFAVCGGFAGLIATIIEVRMHRHASAVVVLMCAASCLLFLLVFWGLLLR